MTPEQKPHSMKIGDRVMNGLGADPSEAVVVRQARRAPANVRLKVIKAMKQVDHRYDRLRALSMGVSMAILAAVPLTGLAGVRQKQFHRQPGVSHV